MALYKILKKSCRLYTNFIYFLTTLLWYHPLFFVDLKIWNFIWNSLQETKAIIKCTIIFLKSLTTIEMLSRHVSDYNMLYVCEYLYQYYIMLLRPIVAQEHSVTLKSTGCGFDPDSRKLNIYLHLYFHFFALVLRQRAASSSASRHAMPPELVGKWETECPNMS